MKFRTALAVAAAALMASAASGDTIQMRDGRTIHGKVTSPDGAPTVVIETQMGTLRYQRAMVREVTKDEKGTAADTSATDEAQQVDPQVRAAFVDATRSASQAPDGKAGLAIWQGFLDKHADSPLGKLAREQRGTWQERADADLVRFGTDWLPREKVQARMSKADELVAKADRADSLEAALAHYNEAMRQHPYRSDIPFRKALKCRDAGDKRAFGQALGEVVAIDKDHAAARSNLGVLAAEQKKWDVAVRQLSIAAASGGDDVVFDNLDQALFAAEQAGWTEAQVSRGYTDIQRIVANLHKDGKHRGQTRWGKEWIPVETYNKYIEENKVLDRKIASREGRLRDMEYLYRKNQRIIRDYDRWIEQHNKNVGDGDSASYRQKDIDYLNELQAKYTKAKSQNRQIETEVKDIRAEVKELESQKHVPPHAGKLVWLDRDGRSIGESSGPAVDAGGGGIDLFAD